MKMKKYIALLLTAILCLFAFAACGDDEVSSEFKDRMMEPYVESIASGNYTYEASAVDGSGSPVTYTKYGDNVLITTTTNDTKTGLMRCNGKYYIVLPSEMSYTDATGTYQETIEDLCTSLEMGNFATASFVESGATTVGGVEYTYEDYYSAVNQIRNRYFFDEDENLVMVGTVGEDGTTTAYTYMNIYGSNESTFDILNTYHHVDENGNVITTTAASAAESAE